MGRIMSFDQDGRRVRDFDKSEHDFLRRYGRTPEEVMDENAKLRKLLLSYWKAVHCPVTPTVPRDYLAEMRELGIEVD